MRPACLRLLPLVIATLFLSPLIAQTPSPSQLETSPTPTPTPKLTPSEARVRLEQLNKQLKELNEKLKSAEEKVLEEDPRLAELKRLMEEARLDYDQATQHWLDVHKRYTELYHRLKQKYERELHEKTRPLQEKIRAIADEYKQKFDVEWATYQAKRAEENRLMQQRHDEALSRAKLAAKDYLDPLFEIHPELNVIRERIRDISAQQRPLIMLLKPTSPPAPGRPLQPATSPPSYPVDSHRPTPEPSP